MAVMTDEDDNMDRISELPEDLKLKIVSMLPVEDGVRMSALSKTWKSLPVSYFDFDITRIENIKIPKDPIPNILSTIDNALRILEKEEEYRQSKRIIGCFRLAAKAERYHSNMDRWLKLVAKHHIKELEVALVRGSYRFPPCAFDDVWTSLVALSLNNCVLDKTLIQKKDTRFSCLKKFRCCEVDFNGLLGEVLSRCPALEEVILVKCTNYQGSELGEWNGKLRTEIYNERAKLEAMVCGRA